MKPTEDKDIKHHWFPQKKNWKILVIIFCDQQIFNQQYFLLLCVGENIYCRSQKCKTVYGVSCVVSMLGCCWICFM